MIVPLGPSLVTQPTIARLDNGSRILAPSIAGVSNRLKITQGWVSAGPLDQDYKIFLHLVDSKNALAAQYDAPEIS